MLGQSHPQLRLSRNENYSRLPNRKPSRAERLIAGLAVVALHLAIAVILVLGVQTGTATLPVSTSDLLGEVDISVPSGTASEPARSPLSSTQLASKATVAHSPLSERVLEKPLTVGSTADQGVYAAGQGAAPGAAQTGSVTAPNSSSATGGTTSDYGRRLLEHIEQNKRYPTSGVADRPSGTVRVLFTVTRNGSVSGVWVQAGSGSPILDREAVATLLRAQPLPPIPADLPDPLNFSFDIEFSPPSLVVSQ